MFVKKWDSVDETCAFKVETTVPGRPKNGRNRFVGAMLWFRAARKKRNRRRG